MRFLLLAFATFFLLQFASAQISPGPLSRAHQSLEGSTQCTTCHKLGGGEAVFRCLDCHREIAERLTARRGLHATYGIKAGSSQECARCHSEHNGREFPVIKWDLKTFDHRQTGYALEGKHAGLTCNRCHSPERIAPDQKPLIKIHDLSRSFLGVNRACSTCHQDVHNGRLGPNCAQCHNSTDWKNTAGQFDHSNTRYPLTGVHAQVKCQECHTPGPDSKPRYAGLPFSKCSDCHTNPHKGSFAQQSCSSCHNTAGWKRVSTATLNQSFDHAKTKYPLLGKHQQVDCVSCHRKADFKRIDESARQHKITVLFNSVPVEFKPETVLLQVDGAPLELANDYVWIFAGGIPPYDFLKKIGIGFGMHDLMNEAKEAALDKEPLSEVSSGTGGGTIRPGPA
jgi:hypothetical protein